MPPPRPKIKILAAGLHHLGAKSQMLAGELSAALPPFVAVSSWQSTAGDVCVADSGSCAHAATLARRLEIRGRNYSTAGANYTAADEAGKAQIAAVWC